MDLLYELKSSLLTILPPSFWDIIDIAVLSYLIYKVIQFMKETRAGGLAKGIIVLVLCYMLARIMQMKALTFILDKTFDVGLLAIIIIFQPELRRALEHLGQGKFLGPSVLLDDEEAQSVVRELAKAVKVMSANKTGALIVIERNMGLNDISATGIQIDGLITADFLLNVFIPNTPLHDGAAIVRGKRLIAAGCLLPLTENRSLSTELGTRHRAAIGLSEQCDALVVVVSEETGTISVAENGRMVRHLDTEKLKNILRPAFTSPQKGLKDLNRNWRKKK